MLFTTISIVLMSGLTIAAPPAILDARAELCAPTSYTITDFYLSYSGSGAVVDFNLKSNFASSTGIEDSVINGSKCHGEGATIPNNNECSAPGRKLLFDLRAAQDKARYQITHTWVCDGKTWMSGTDVTVGPLRCDPIPGGASCGRGPFEFAPQNVRQICGTPTC